MRAGEMDRLVTIRQVTVARDAVGGEVETWSDLAIVWAKVRPAAGTEYTGIPGTVAKDTKEISIWHRTDVTRRMKVDVDGDLYDISRISEIGRREGLKILGTAQVT